MRNFYIIIRFYIICLVLLCVAVNINHAAAQNLEPSFDGVWFSTVSPWNMPIGNTPELPVSKAAVQAFVKSGKTINMNWDVWTPAIIEADSRTDKTTDIVFADYFKFKWRLAGVPYNQDLLDYMDYLSTRKDTDRKVCIYDAAKKGFYSFWKIRLDKHGEPTATVGGFSPIDGPGWTRIIIKPRLISSSTPGLGSAAGANYCGGLVRVKEMEAGHINHALAIQWPNSQVLHRRAEKPSVQFPATGSDGLSYDKSVAIPSGTRLQLSPALTMDDLRRMGLNDADIIIAHALQEYGGYIMDTTQGPGAISFENAFGKGRHVYKASSQLPKALYHYLRFVGPPPVVELDIALKVGTPISEISY